MAGHLRRYGRSLFRGLLLVTLAAPALLGSAAYGQHAEETARQRIWLKAYGMYSYVDPDYGSSAKNNGGTVGIDIDGFRLLPHTELGLDARYTGSNGPVTNQHYFGGGPRLSLDLGPLKPYADFIVGHGTGDFNNSTDPSYTHDRTGAISYGGGVDYQLTRSWGLRADVQRERWRYSVRQPFFYPTAFSVGVTYQFFFHGRTGPNL